MFKRIAKEFLLKTGCYFSMLEIRGKSPSTKEALKFFSNFVKENGLVFDIGANLGFKSDVFLQLGARVIAFEPQPSCLPYLKSRQIWNQRLTIDTQAVSSRAGTLSFFISSSHTLSTLSKDFIHAAGNEKFSGEKWESEMEVQATTLDACIQKYGAPDFIKLDVEGNEAEILEGLSIPVKALSFEFNHFLPKVAEQCLQKLYLLNPEYLFNYTLGESPFFLLDKSCKFEIFSERVLPEIMNQRNFGDIYAFTRQP